MTILLAVAGGYARADLALAARPARDGRSIAVPLGIRSRLGQCETTAAEMALRRRERCGEEIIGISVGTAKQDSLLYLLAARGVERVVRIAAEDVELDASLVATYIEEFVRLDGTITELYCGSHADLWGSGLTPVVLSAMLGWPIVSESGCTDPSNRVVVPSAACSVALRSGNVSSALTLRSQPVEVVSPSAASAQGRLATELRLESVSHAPRPKIRMNASDDLESAVDVLVRGML
jgi:hypothetical protein